MIITNMKGGVGNQLFQWAIAKNLSLIYDTSFLIDTNYYSMTNHVTPRTFKLNNFKNLKFSLYTNQIVLPLISVHDDFFFKKISIEKGNNYRLDGYWQSEKYFKESEFYIRQDLKMSNDKLTNFYNLYPQLNENTLSLHVRRGDYIVSGGYHPLCSIEYYQESVDIFTDYDYLFVFSDDVNWCKEYLKFKNIIFIENQSEIEDLYLMSLCKNNIIANSSFSWWGAWLNDNLDKKVICPNFWFGPHVNLNTDDIIPENWIKI